MITSSYFLLLIILSYPNFINAIDVTLENATCKNDSVIIRALLKTHNKRKAPSSPGHPVNVTVEIWVQDVSRIVEVTSEFELDIYVTEQWLDSSLSYEDFNPCKLNLSVKADKILPKIWTPNSCFINSRNATIHESPYKNMFLMFYSNGTVWLNYRIKLTGPCAKDLKTFPIDNQRCFLTYESFHHSKDDVTMHWTADPVTFMKKVRLPDYELVDSFVQRFERVSDLEE